MQIHYLCGWVVQPVGHGLTVWLLSEAQADVRWGGSVGVSRAWLDHSGLQEQVRTGEPLTTRMHAQNTVCFYFCCTFSRATRAWGKKAVSQMLNK